MLWRLSFLSLVGLSFLIGSPRAMTQAPATPAVKEKSDSKAADKKADSKAAPAKKAPPERPTPTIANFKYGNESERQVFDFWQAKSDKPTPVVLLIHGGGWKNGDKTGYGTSSIKPFLDQGISVASINYRFINQAMEQKVEPPVKACVTDAGRALQTIRSKAREWNIDPQRVGATGGSAGACTSLWLAFHDDLADPKSSDPIARESTRLTAAAVSGPQTSLDPKQLREWIPNSIYGGHAFGFAGPNRDRAGEFDLLLENREKVLPWIKEYSPIELVTKDDPAVYMEFGAAPNYAKDGPDPTHSAIYGIKLAERMNEVGVPATVSYPGKKDTEYGSINNFLIKKLTEKK
jgi:acetyl esterase/lipase